MHSHSPIVIRVLIVIECLPYARQFLYALMLYMYYFILSSQKQIDIIFYVWKKWDILKHLSNLPKVVQVSPNVNLFIIMYMNCYSKL